mgnify:CR=1 FL=1
MIARLIYWSIANRFLVLLATLLLTAWGIISLTRTPLDALPEDAKEAAFGAGLQSGAFDTTFVDDDVRVSRGDRGETRVFVR